MIKNYTVADFLLERKLDSNFKQEHAEGVYMLINQSKGKYYVGQSKEMSERVFIHITGRGNGDVYADYKYGDEFEIRFYRFNKYQFRDLNEFEYHLIRIYCSNKKGYNRQAGNRTRQIS